jgi:hypothetical protein
VRVLIREGAREGSVRRRTKEAARIYRNAREPAHVCNHEPPAAKAAAGARQTSVSSCASAGPRPPPGSSLRAEKVSLTDAVPSRHSQRLVQVVATILL